MKNYVLLGGIMLIMLGLSIQVNAQELDLSGIELPNIPAIDKPIKEMTKTEIQAKITEILSVIQQLQAILSQLTGHLQK